MYRAQRKHRENAPYPRPCGVSRCPFIYNEDSEPANKRVSRIVPHEGFNETGALFQTHSANEPTNWVS